MGRAKEQVAPSGETQAEPSTRRKVAFKAFVVLLILVVVGLGLIYSGWLLAQAVRWSATARLAEVVTPLFPARIRAPGYGIALSSQNEAVRQEAAEALELMGPEAQAAVPKLVKALKDREAETRRAALDALARMGDKAREATPQIVAALRDRNEQVRVAAVEALARIRARADVAVPALKERLDDAAAAVRRAARAALEKMGEENGASVEPEPEAEN